MHSAVGDPTSLRGDGPLTASSCFMSDLNRWIEQLRRCQPLKEHEVKDLCEKALEILVEESNVQRVDAPITICKTLPTLHTLFWKTLCLASRARTVTSIVAADAFGGSPTELLRTLL